MTARYFYNRTDEKGTTDEPQNGEMIYQKEDFKFYEKGISKGKVLFNDASGIKIYRLNQVFNPHFCEETYIYNVIATNKPDHVLTDIPLRDINFQRVYKSHNVNLNIDENYYGPISDNESPDNI